MKSMRKIALTCSLLLIAIGLAFGTAVAKKPVADAIYYNGTILTVDKKMSTAKALAVAEGKILAVGSVGKVMKYSGSATKHVNLQGKTLLPGFYDPHGHFGGANWRYVALGSGPFGPIKNIADLIAALEARAESTPAGEAVLGSGYDDIFMAEQRHPTLTDLDQASTDHPIIITHFSGHGRVINSYALAETAVDYNGTTTPDPAGGVIGRFPDGKPNGQFFGNAQALVVKRDGTSFIPAATVQSQLEDIAYYSNAYASVGATTANNGGMLNLASFNLYKQATDEGYLKIRATLWFSLAGGIAVHDLLGGDTPGTSRKLPKYAGKDDLVVANGIKFWADGSPQLRTALMTDPYYTTGPYPADWKGLSYMTRDQTIAAVVGAHNAGFDQIAIHSNGDACTDNVLDAYEEVRKPNYRQSDNLRHTVIHNQFSREEQYDRMAEMGGIIPSFLGLHIYYLADRHWEIFFGPERSARMSAAADAVYRNIIWTAHADAPVFEHKPLLVMWAMVNRISYGGREVFTEHYDPKAKYRSTDQRVSAEEALRAITINAAYQENEDKVTGSLEVGKRADMVILAKNPLTIDPIRIKDIKVVQTLVGGKTVYKAPAK